MSISGNYGYLVINNSNRIEVVSMTDFSSVKSVPGLHSPRFMTVVNPSKAYVSNLQGGVSVFDLASQTVTGTVPTSSWTENMIRYKDVVLVTSIGSFSEPSSGRKAFVFVIDAQTDQIVDSIATGKEPIGLVIDKKEKVWILCSGGYDNFEAPTLLRVDPDQRIVEKKFTFDNPLSVPSRLCMNPTGDTMYFLRGGICRMAVTDIGLPQQPFIASEGRLLYGLAIQPSTGHLFTSDAVDYVQNGKVYEYRQSGNLIRSFKAGRIPGSFCFKD
jgi:DNA-binding beta-propeller fold protein YncE